MLRVSVNDRQLDITLDSGATVSYLRYTKATELGITILPNNQLALLADQKTRMASLGEVDFIVLIQGIQLRLRALVMKNLQAECFGGTTFHVDNKIEPKIRDGQIILHGKYAVDQSNPFLHLPLHPPPSEKLDDATLESKYDLKMSSKVSDEPELYFAQSQLNTISMPSANVILPSEFLKIPIPSKITVASHLSITPSFPDAYDKSCWQPQICDVVNGQALFRNNSSQPLIVPKYAHFKPHSVRIMNMVDAVPDSPTLSSRRWSSQRIVSPSSQSKLVLPIEDLISAMKISL